MAKIVKFIPKDKISPETVQLCQFSDDLDAVIKYYLVEKGLDLKDIVGVMSHRLGNVLELHDQKDKLWEICHEVLKKQASLNKKPS